MKLIKGGKDALLEELQSTIFDGVRRQEPEAVARLNLIAERLKKRGELYLVVNNTRKVKAN